MSTERFARPLAVARGAGLVVLATCTARAADVDFRPAMTFGLFHSGSLSVTGSEHGDEGADLAFDLTLERKTPKSVFAFTYRPSYVAYRESSDLDYFGNTIILAFARDSSLASRFSVDAYVSQSDSQGQTTDTADRATTFVPRTTLTHGTVRVGGTVVAGRRGLVDWQLHAGADRYEDVKDDPATVLVNEAFDFNNSTDVGGRVAWRGELSVRNSLGVGLEAASFGFENKAGVIVESVRIVGACQASQTWLLDYSAGVSRATSADESIDGFSFDAKIAYAVGKASAFSAGARQVFSPGTGLTGSTQDRGVWASYGHNPTAWGLSGSVVGGYWQRNELQFAGAGLNQDSTAFTVNGLIGWKFNRFVALDWAYAFVDQRAHNGAAATLNTSYSNYGLFLRWAIRGR